MTNFFEWLCLFTSPSSCSSPTCRVRVSPPPSHSQYTQVGTGFSDAEFESHTKFFKDHLISGPRPYYLHGSGADQPDVWFDAVQVSPSELVSLLLLLLLLLLPLLLLLFLLLMYFSANTMQLRAASRMILVMLD